MTPQIENFIGVFENAFSWEFCQECIGFFDRLEDSGMTYNRQQAENVKRNRKDDRSAYLFNEDIVDLKYTKYIRQQFGEVFWNEIYPIYSQEFIVLDTASEKQQIKSLKLQKTKIGGGYHEWHYESSSSECAERVLTYILYLNDVDEGAETEFLYYPRRIKPKAGTFILFPASFSHTHRGNPPISGDKYIITGWTEF